MCVFSYYYVLIGFNFFDIGLWQGFQDQGEKVEFSGPLLSQSNRIDELLERHERQMRRAVRKSWFHRGMLTVKGYNFIIGIRQYWFRSLFICFSFFFTKHYGPVLILTHGCDITSHAKDWDEKRALRMVGGKCWCIVNQKYPRPIFTKWPVALERLIRWWNRSGQSVIDHQVNQ